MTTPVTRQAFTRDGYLISGDIAYKDQGYLFIRGRHDDMFNVGGEKVAPLEIERVLNASPVVEVAAVTGLPDVARGMVPVAFLKLKQPVTIKESATGLTSGTAADKNSPTLLSRPGLPDDCQW